MNNFKTVLTGDSLKVYEVSSMIDSGAPKHYFWGDNTTPECVGPFATLADAMTNFHQVTAITNGPSVPAVQTNEGKVISVDFVAKRVIAGTQ